MMLLFVVSGVYLANTAIIFFFINGIVYPNWSLRAAFRKNEETFDLLRIALQWPLFIISPIARLVLAFWRSLS